MVPFQSNQLLAEPAGPGQAQETQLPEDTLLQLAEVEWQYAAARYQILEKAQAFPTNSHVREATAGYPYTATGEAATGSTGAYDSSSMPAYTPQIPSYGFIPSDGSSLPLQAVGPVPVPANQLPAYMANDIGHGTMVPLATSPLWDEDLTLSAGRSFDTTMHELPPVAETIFDATETLDTTGTTDLLVPTRATRGKPKYGKRTQSVAASPYHRKTGPGREMENVSFYTDPEAYSQQQKDQPKQKQTQVHDFDR
ncbi:hypothetical protein J4E81_007412 [Alternaria sp. BMP 2799]|nr:hypothetical protein J4E81_007412 [Alternaria sp. BMP 2799]